MKKLILSAAIILGGLSTMSAQEAMPEQSATPTEETMPAETAAATETDATTATATASTQTGYSEISNDEVPSAVSDALVKAYPNATVSKAYVNENNQYQLDVKVDDKEGSLFADENGKWIQN
ncbi:hypothetical protein [Flavobacterium algicola]|uniref:hypothetical protein n=1 Tax=Flavobacterium algicola TaxID=556529 RepID=UPI001EFDEAD5|nr:hypothetical protein [Flavobacterium algicola]MCG9792140.1 hypothetical protein [Flavobacterium algicola]